ncbi:MAG: tRNA glutamyl-Q(34) synthetase GluQRS [Desulfuromonadales bacterium]
MTPVGRFAPSPTGALHTGSLATAVGSYLLAKRGGGRWLLRIDDLDAPRQIAGMADDIMRTLETFGLQWDGEVSRQSGNIENYRQAFEQLKQSGLVYPCGCSRREIAASASAPHHDDDCIPYPGSCHTGLKPGAAVRSWRIQVPDRHIGFRDLRCGDCNQNLFHSCGDLAIRRGDGGFAYQLAVVVDDFLTGVTQVVRGDDLLASTPRQIFLQQQLGFPQPEYCHLPLVCGPGGTKLSKRDNLVSHRLGNWSENENQLLHAILRFHGQNPPLELVTAPCSEILDWGITHFDVGQLPVSGGELMPGM